MKTKLHLPFLSAIFLLIVCSFKNPKDHLPVPERLIHTNTNRTAAAPSLPQFRIVNTEGTVMNLAQLKGKKVFVNLWASWCPPCRKELPSIEKLYQSVDKEKVVFIMLSLDRNFETAQGFAKMKKLNLPLYYPAENLPGLFNVPGIPVTFIFNEKGELIQEIDGGDNYNTKQYKELLNF